MGRKFISILIILLMQSSAFPISVFAQEAALLQNTKPVKNITPQRVIIPQSKTSRIFSLASFNDSGSSANIRIPMSLRQMEKKQYKAEEDVTVVINNPENEAVQAQVVDVEGKKADVTIDATENLNQITVNVSPRSQFRPGKYTFIATDSTGNSYKQDFSWGVLAINPDRSIYAPNQMSDLALGVLDDRGNMVCDANVSVRITNSKLNINDELSTANGSIIINPECSSHSFTLKPDYEAHYKLGGEGTYTMNVSAKTANGTYSISDSIEVKQSVPFDVQRISATRIYPPNTYPVHLNITANQDFSGTITETVPDSFTITSLDDTNSYDSMHTLYMDSSSDPAHNLGDSVLGASTSALIAPFAGDFPITQQFGAEETYQDLRSKYQSYGMAGHDGIDFGLPIGTPVYAVDDGNIIKAGLGDYGQTVVIEHSWGKSYYGHLSIITVGEHTHITKGSQIGLSGNTGESTGPHLHFGIKPEKPDMTNGYFGKINPMPYLNLNSPSQLAQAPPILETSVLAASTSADTDSSSVKSFELVQAGIDKDTVIFDKQLRKQTLKVPTTADEEKVKVISWNVALKKGDTVSLGYAFKAPEISPQFYLLGPLQFFDNQSSTSTQLAEIEKPIFQESRQWQIAADAIGTHWYNNNWQYRQVITVDRTQVPSTQTNIPILISLSSNTKLSAKAQTTGNDILFTSSNGQTKLDHEIESYTSGTGALIAWVEVPTLSSSTDTVIYMYYGNAAATDQQNITGTWSNSFQGVWHLDEASGTRIDSTSNNNDLGENGTGGVDSATGQIKDAGLFASADVDYLNITDAAQVGLNITGNITIQAWVFPTNVAASSNAFVTKDGTGGNTGYSSRMATGNLAFKLSGDGTTSFTDTNAVAMSNSTWYGITTRYNGSAIQTILDADMGDATTAFSGSIFDSTADFEIGARNGSGNPFDGRLDEVWVSNTSRSNDWITTTYNNQLAPSTFSSIDTIEETRAYAPLPSELMRHGKFFDGGVEQPFVF